MKEKLIDLHTHTLFSDGRESAENLIKMAKEKNIEIISITDHDSVYVYDIIKNICPIKIIKGIELSVLYENKIIHILGYGLDLNNTEIRKYCDKVFKTSLKRTKEYLKILDKYNINLPKKIIKEFIEKKYPVQYERLFSIMYKLNIGFDREALENEFLIVKNNITMPYMNLDNTIKLIKSAGGYSILAHPYKYKFENTESRLDFFKRKGVDGIECYHSDAPKWFINYLIKYCTENKLMISGGSDSHKYYKNVDNKRVLGYGTMNNLCITKKDVSKKLIDLAKGFDLNK